MRKLFIILFLLFAVSAEAAAPSRQNTYVSGTVIESADVTANEDAIFNYLQAGVSVYEDSSIYNADINSSANIQSDKLNLTAIAQSVANSGSTTLTGTFAANGTTNSIGNGGSDTLTLNVPGGMTLSAATTWTLTGALTFSGTIADLGTVTTADINGGTLDGVQIGGTTATGELIVNDSNDDADGLGSQGTAGQFLMSNGAGSNPSFTSGMRLLSTTSFSGDTTLQNVSITADKKYLVFITITDTSVDSFLFWRFQSDSTATSYQWLNDEIVYSTTPSSALTGDDADSEITFGDIDGDGTDGLQCKVLFDAEDINNDIHVYGECGGIEGGGSIMTRTVRGSYRTGGTLTTFGLIISTGNMTGKITTYEIDI